MQAKVDLLQDLPHLTLFSLPCPTQEAAKIDIGKDKRIPVNLKRY